MLLAVVQIDVIVIKSYAKISTMDVEIWLLSWESCSNCHWGFL